MKNDRILRIYTDGGCAGNQSDENLGGWGAISMTEFADASKELYGSSSNTTNNRMEMTALLEDSRLSGRMASRYRSFLTAAISWTASARSWYAGWQKNGWQTAAKKPVENQDLWKQLLPYHGRSTDISFLPCQRAMSVMNSKSVQISTSCTQSSGQWNGAEFSYEDFIYVTGKERQGR